MRLDWLTLRGADRRYARHPCPLTTRPASRVFQKADDPGPQIVANALLGPWSAYFTALRKLPGRCPDDGRDQQRGHG